MNKDEFVNAVSYMRKMQKEYFRTRAPRALEESKKAEKKVDKLLEEINSPGLF